jgi:glycosyltransferase involved in cell wall biosynthesis
MRLLLLTADYPPATWSGIGTAVFHQASALAAIGADARVLTLARVEEGPRVHRLSAERFPIAVEAGDVVLLHSLALAELALELQRRYGLPLVYTAHALVEIELGSVAAPWAAVQRRLFDAADLVIFVSRAEAGAAAEIVPLLAGRATVLHNGLPAPPPPRAYDPSGPIVFAGRFTRSKGFDLVLDVAAAIGPPFVLAGGHGDADLHRAAAALARDGRCRLAGWLDRAAIEDLFASAALVIMPSRYEPFGMVALEAMRMGAPLLASARGGLTEIVGPPDSGGRCVRDLDAPAWIAAARALMSDPAEREALHRHGPAYVARRFDAAARAADLLAIVERMHAGRIARPPCPA